MDRNFFLDQAHSRYNYQLSTSRNKGIPAKSVSIQYPTSNLVDILQGETQWLVCGSARGINCIKGFQQCGPSERLLFLAFLDFPILEPCHVAAWLHHVIAMPTRNWHKRNSVRVVAYLLDVGRNLLFDLQITSLKQTSVNTSI